MYNFTYMPLDVIKVFLPATLTFLVGIFLTPRFTYYFYKYKLWKGVSRKDNVDAMSVAFLALHNDKEETSTPRVGGIIVWFSVFVTTMLLWLVARFVPGDTASKFDFVSRSQTWLPFAGLLLGGFIGLFEDFVEIFGKNGRASAQGISSKYLILIILAIGTLVGWWFFEKLGISTIHIPFNGDIDIGLLFIPFFAIVMLGVFSSRVIDGIDGLAAGVLSIVFSSYAVIAFFENQIDLAVFSAVVAGAILSFLWFNIPPARFYMGETGMLSLAISLTVIVFMTGEVLLLIIVGLPLVVTSLSSAIQIFSKKYFHKKVFKIAPLHHHFEALGWSRAKITMRYWIISLVSAVIGIVIALIS